MSPGSLQRRNGWGVKKNSPAKGASSERVSGSWGFPLGLVQLCWPLSAQQPLKSTHVILNIERCCCQSGTEGCGSLTA